MSAIKLKLKAPIQHGSETIAELEFKEPKAKHLRKLPESPIAGDILDLAGKLCGQPPSVIDELSMADTKAVLEIVGNLLGDGLGTGSKP